MEYSAGALLILLLLYFVPSVIANGRRHRNENSIFLTNLFLGWTFLGWVGALIWSASDNCRPKPKPTIEQLEKNIKNSEQLNRLLDGFFATLGALAGAAIAAFGLYQVAPFWQWPIDLHNDKIQFGITLLALGIIIGGRALVGNKKKKPTTVRALATILGLPIIAFAVALGISAFLDKNATQLQVEYGWALLIAAEGFLICWFGMRKGIPSHEHLLESAAQEFRTKKPQLYSSK